MTSVTVPCCDACRHRLDAGRLRPLDHDVRQQRRRHVDIADRQAHQAVAHRTADHAPFAAIGVEKRKHAAERRIAEPGFVGKAGHA